MLIQPNQGIVFPSVTYVRNLITKAGTKQVTGFFFRVCLLSAALQRKRHLCKPRKGIAQPLSQLPNPNLCVCELFIYCIPRIGPHIFLSQNRQTTLQTKGRWESNIKVRFPFIYSQKWNCAALLFSKQNFNILSPNSHTHISVREIYIFPGSVCLFCCSQICGPILVIQYIKSSQTHDCSNWDWGCAVPSWEYINWIFGTVRSCECMNRSQTHECRNKDWGRAIPFWEYLFLIFGIVSLQCDLAT